MDLRDLLHALRRSWWLVVTAVVVTVGFSAYWTAAAVPQYATATTFFVNTTGNEVGDAYQGGLFSQQRVKSYAALLTGDRLAKAIAADRSLGLTPTQIQARITARVVPDTVSLEATVTDSDPDRSGKVARSLVTQFVKLVKIIETPPGAKNSAVKVEIVDGPLLNPVPVSPQPTRNLALGILLGLLVGAGAAVLREMLDITIKSAELLSTLTGAPVLAVVPFDRAARRNPLVMGGTAHSARAEAFRHMRTNLRFLDVDRPVKVLVVTSAVPGEGKSTTAVNLAIAFAEAGGRVLLIEADLRRPRIADYLSLEGSVGLSDVLARRVEVDDVLQPWGSHGLQVLTSGFIPPNPSEVLGSAAMASLLARLREDFDMVVIDTPPLLPVTDAAVVAVKADGALLVTRSGKTARTQVARAVADLRTVDARVLGCVLNMQPGKTDKPYYYDQASRHASAVPPTPSVPPIPSAARTPSTHRRVVATMTPVATSPLPASVAPNADATGTEQLDSSALRPSTPPSPAAPGSRPNHAEDRTNETTAATNGSHAARTPNGTGGHRIGRRETPPPAVTFEQFKSGRRR